MLTIAKKLSKPQTIFYDGTENGTMIVQKVYHDKTPVFWARAASTILCGKT